MSGMQILETTERAVCHPQSSMGVKEEKSRLLSRSSGDAGGSKIRSRSCARCGGGTVLGLGRELHNVAGPGLHLVADVAVLGAPQDGNAKSLVLKEVDTQLTTRELAEQYIVRRM